MTKKLLPLADFLKLNYIKGEWKTSTFKDVYNGVLTTVLLCPRCGAVVGGDPAVHYNWHKETGR
jgi:hypothetical protein